MRGKHPNPIVHFAAFLQSERLRAKLSDLVAWEPLSQPEPGCTVVLGMCSRLPQVIHANLRCLAASRWAGLRRIIVSVDAATIANREAIERDARSYFPDLPVDFVYYSKEQARVAEKIMLPCPYAWLSWCNGIRDVRTEHLLIHDYDALILGKSLGRRYEQLRRSGAKVQGIKWYDTNGVEAADRLATTFELFCDTAWLRSFEPIDLFNKVRIKDGRSIHFDITLDVQDRFLKSSERELVAMDDDELVHPSQMIHQYTMFRRFPAKALPSIALPMIPFFGWLGGDESAIERSIEAIEKQPVTDVDLLSDGTRINLTRLDTLGVDWALKLMVQAAVKLGLQPDPRLHLYGRALYRCSGTPAEQVWKGDFSDSQRAWIETAASAPSWLAGPLPRTVSRAS